MRMARIAGSVVCGGLGGIDIGGTPGVVEAGMVEGIDVGGGTMDGTGGILGCVTGTGAGVE